MRQAKPGKAQPSERYRYLITVQEKVTVHSNLFDSSVVEYYTDNERGQFDIVFDQKLYDAPKITLDLEKKMAEEALRLRQAQK